MAAGGLQPEDLADPERLLDLEGVLRLTQAAAEEAGDDALGLHLGERWDLGSLGVLSYAVFNAPTVGTALRNLDRYGRSHIQGGGIRLSTRGAEAWLGYELAVRDPELARQHVEAAATVGVRILRRLLGDGFQPRRVLFGHRRPREVSEHRRVFGCAPEFGCSDGLAIVFDASVLPLPVPGADRRLLPLIERHLAESLADGEEDAWLSELRGAVTRSLCDGSPSIRSTAKQLGMSVRTLQRRLEAHDVAFRDLVAETRRTLAQRYLAEGSANLTEVAFLLGYSELSAFDRAFRRWTGSTPLAERRRLRAAD